MGKHPEFPAQLGSGTGYAAGSRDRENAGIAGSAGINGEQKKEAMKIEIQNRQTLVVMQVTEEKWGEMQNGGHARHWKVVARKPDVPVDVVEAMKKATSKATSKAAEKVPAKWKTEKPEYVQKQTPDDDPGKSE
jgi:hypothetical protein